MRARRTLMSRNGNSDLTFKGDLAADRNAKDVWNG